MTVGRALSIAFASWFLGLISSGATQAAQSPGPAERPDPSGAYKAMRTALEAGDAAGAIAMFADDAEVVGGPACTKLGPCSGKGAIRQNYVAYFAVVHLKTSVLSEKVTGDTAESRMAITTDLVRSRGLERVVAYVVTKVRDGRIVSLVHTADMSDSITAAYFSMNPRLGPK